MTVCKNDSWGIINQDGKYIAPTRFFAVKNFHNNIALIKLETGWAYINLQGQVISLNKTYSCENEFSEGYAAVKENGKWGYIDTTGNYMIEPQFEAAHNFSEGLAAVKGIGSGWGYIGSTGKFVLNPNLKYAEDFSCGVAIVITGEEKVFMNKTGQFLPNAQDYKVADMFSENLAPVKKGTLYGYIDTSGNFAIEPAFNTASGFSKGFATVRIRTAYGLINNQGELVIPAEYYSVSYLGDSVVKVGVSPTSFNFLDMKTNLIIGKNKPYIVLGGFQNGLALIEFNKLFGFIRKDGKVAIEIKYQNARNFSNGLAAVKYKGLWGFIDTAGNVVVQPQYENVGEAVRVDE